MLIILQDTAEHLRTIIDSFILYVVFTGSATKATKGGRGKSGDTTAESTTDAGAGTGAEDEQGSSAISSILQKALLKRVQMLATERK